MLHDKGVDSLNCITSAVIRDVASNKGLGCIFRIQSPAPACWLTSNSEKDLLLPPNNNNILFFPDDFEVQRRVWRQRRVLFHLQARNPRICMANACMKYFDYKTAPAAERTLAINSDSLGQESIEIRWADKQ